MGGHSNFADLKARMAPESRARAEAKAADMTDAWTELANKAGRRCVMSTAIDEAALDTETARQIEVLVPMLRPLLTGREHWALDYGSGAGRFCSMLADFVQAGVIGYEPCHVLRLASPQDDKRVAYSQRYPQAPAFDVIFTAMVLGAPDIDLDATAAELAGILAPGGLFILLDHMPEEPPKGRWWRYLPEDVYQRAFATNGIALERIGKLWQLDNEVTVLAGRKPR